MNCDRCGATMVTDRLSGDVSCLPCVRRSGVERLWRDGLARARAELRRAS